MGILEWGVSRENLQLPEGGRLRDVARRVAGGTCGRAWHELG